MNLSTRSYQKELLDEDEIPREDLFRNLYELNQINRLLGGHAVTIKGLERLNLSKNQKYTLIDIGCGGGDTLKAIALWARKKGFHIQLTGVDYKSDCIQYARQFCHSFSEIDFKQSDYRDLDDASYDIVISSLFCHHLNDDELVVFFKQGTRIAKYAILMNDLHRHKLAYYSIQYLTQLFSQSYLVKNDAKLSVKRGFVANEIKQILEIANIKQFRLEWCWAFRWLLTIHTSKDGRN